MIAFKDEEIEYTRLNVVHQSLTPTGVDFKLFVDVGLVHKRMQYVQHTMYIPHLIANNNIETIASLWKHEQCRLILSKKKIFFFFNSKRV